MSSHARIAFIVSALHTGLLITRHVPVAAKTQCPSMHRHLQCLTSKSVQDVDVRAGFSCRTNFYTNLRREPGFSSSEHCLKFTKITWSSESRFSIWAFRETLDASSSITFAAFSPSMGDVIIGTQDKRCPTPQPDQLAGFATTSFPDPEASAESPVSSNLHPTPDSSLL